MRWHRAAAGAGVLLALSGVPARAAAPPDLPALEAQLAAVTTHAQQLTDALEAARSRDGGLRQAVDDLDAAHAAAVARLDARVRELYISSGPALLDGWGQLADAGRAVRVARGQAGGARVERDLVDAVSTRSAAARRLQEQAAAFREQLRGQAVAVLAEQDRARDLLAAAQALAARQQAERAAQQARQAQQVQAQQAQQAQQRELARLSAARAALDAVSATVTEALAPAMTSAQSARSRQAARDEAPVIALLVAAGSGYPAGYAPTGSVITGTASWYGPGFVGSPTATGRPYDPEQPTCAHKSLPLGTVLHVTANGRSTNCLVDDRGPYVGDRVLDLSRAGSRALGYDGTAQVVAEVLEPTGP